MKKRFSIITSLFLAIIILTSLFSGCQSANPSTNNTQAQTTVASQATTTAAEKKGLSPDDPYKITMLWPFDKPPKWSERDVGKEVAQKTGITIEFLPTMGDSAEYHSVLLASGDFPDVVTVDQGAELTRYVESNSLIELDSLMKENCPTYYNLLADPNNGNLVAVYKSMYNGGLYFWGMTGDSVINRPGQKGVFDFFADKVYFNAFEYDAVCMLYPTIKEFTGVKPKCLSDVYALYKAYQSKYGKQKHYAVTTYNNAGQEQVNYSLKINGYMVPGLAKKMGEDKWVYPFMAPPVLDYMKFLNKLYREGLMDPEGPIQTEENLQAKLNNAEVFSIIAKQGLAANANLNMQKVEDLKNNMYIPAVMKEPDVNGKFYHKNAANIGWRMVGITKNCKRPDKVLQFFEWFASTDEGPLLVGYGKEGRDYVMDAKGEPDFTDEIVKNRDADYVNDMFWIWAYMMTPSRTPSGYPVNPWNAAYNMNQVDSPVAAEVKASPFEWNYDATGAYYREYNFFGITFGADDPLGISKKEADTLVNDAVTKMIMAKSEAEVDEIYKNTCQKMNDSGIQKYVDFMNQKYNEKAALTGSKN